MRVYDPNFDSSSNSAEWLKSMKERNEPMTAIVMKDDVYWVGVRDPELRIFDAVMTTDIGTSYNAYLVKGSEKTVLMEVCEDKFFDQYVENVKSVANLADIDYLIMNHTEPDHSEAVAKLIDLVPFPPD